MRSKARQAASKHRRKLDRRWRKQRARLKLRHSNAFYLFLGLIMCIGPPLLIGGAACLTQAAWLQATVGRDRTAYAKAVEQWGQLERERFRHAAPALILNTSLPGALTGMLELHERAVQPVVSRLEGGDAYLPLRYALSPMLRYSNLQYHSHRAVATLGLELYASAGPTRDDDGQVVPSARVRVGTVPSVSLIRERHERTTSVHCTAGKGIYDFRHNLCTKFEVLRKLCVALRPRPIQSAEDEAAWLLVQNTGAAGCEPPAGARSTPQALPPAHVPSELDADEDDQDGDGATTIGGNGWGLSVFSMGATTGAPPPPPLAGTLYEEVYLGEFLEQTLSGEIAIVIISAGEPGFVATTLASLSTLEIGAVMPTSWVPVRLSFPILLMGGAMSIPWCVCITRSRQATLEERGAGGDSSESGGGPSYNFSSDDADEMDDLFADLEGGDRTNERVPLLGVGLGGQASRHRRWQPPMINQQMATGGSRPAAASNPRLQQESSSTRRNHGAPMEHQAPTSVTVSGTSNSNLAGRLESTALPTVDVSGADFIHFASELGVNLATEPFAHDSIVAALRAPLPAPWSAHPTPPDAPTGESGSVYYYNADSQESTYSHPLLEQTRFVVTRQRQEQHRGLKDSSSIGFVSGRRTMATRTISPSTLQQPAFASVGSNQSGPDLAQAVPETDDTASGASAAWEARRRQLEIAAESPELGYADPWADPGGSEEDVSPKVPPGRDVTVGYIDSWAAQQQVHEQEQARSPEHFAPTGLPAREPIGAAAIDSGNGTILMPPGSHNFEARLASLSGSSGIPKPTNSSRHIMPAPTPAEVSGILAPPMAQQLEARLASLEEA